MAASNHVMTPGRKHPSTELLSRKDIAAGECPIHMWHQTVASFGMHMDEGATAVGVAAERWYKGTTCSVIFILYKCSQVQ